MYKKLISCFFLLLASSLFSLEPVFVVLGPPGSGKGTFAQRAKQEGYLHLSAGDFIRGQIAKKTPFGLEVEEIVRRGEYVDRSRFFFMIKETIRELASQNKPLVLDGVIRFEEDLNELVSLLSDLGLSDKTLILCLDAEDEICKRRILTRLVCSSCDHVHTASEGKKSRSDICTVCQIGKLEERINDIDVVAEKRLKDYRAVIEKSYQRALNLFPTLFFDSGQEKGACLAFYEKLLFSIASYKGNAKGFVETYDFTQK